MAATGVQRETISIQDLDFFTVPRELLAREPPEVRGQARDASRLLVLDRSSNSVQHSHMHDIDRYLRPGDIMVLNNSQTVPSVFPARRADGRKIMVYLCSDRGQKLWHVQFEPGRDLTIGMRFVAEHEGQAMLHGEIVGQHASIPGLYEVRLAYAGDLVEILLKIAAPVYSTYTRQRWNLEYYQNLHGQVPGSVELPAAGRHFSSELLSRLTAYGVQIVYITLHTGMSNLMITEERVSDHSMYDEYFSIDETTAETITRGREQGGRVFGVGTTVMRALESVADERGRLKPFSGWTSLFISPGFRFKIIDIFLTNFHGPRTTRLALAMAFAGIDLVKRGYLEAIDQKYLFYEFGDATLTI